MEDYEEIFSKRGKSYHEAMEQFPDARNEEFLTTVKFLNNKSESTILDIPSGGGYLKRFLNSKANYLPYDFSGEFVNAHAGINKCKESSIDLEDNSVDEIVSLAAMHHVVEREAFYGEMNRILKPGGRLVIVDVVSGTKIDSFLNVFLDAWNSMGHKGRFITINEDETQLQAAGFEVEFEIEGLNWVFSNEEEAHQFFRKLFYLDKDPPAGELKFAIEDLGVSITDSSFEVNWPLGFIVATNHHS